MKLESFFMRSSSQSSESGPVRDTDLERGIIGKEPVVVAKKRTPEEREVSFSWRKGGAPAAN
jgi:hypothetical protein